MADEAILKIRTESASFDAFQKSFDEFTKTLQDLPKMWGIRSSSLHTSSFDQGWPKPPNMNTALRFY
jgi:hypothetical protein